MLRCNVLTFYFALTICNFRFFHETVPLRRLHQSVQVLHRAVRSQKVRMWETEVVYLYCLQPRVLAQAGLAETRENHKLQEEQTGNITACYDLSHMI